MYPRFALNLPKSNVFKQLFFGRFRVSNISNDSGDFDLVSICAFLKSFYNAEHKIFSYKFYKTFFRFVIKVVTLLCI